MKLPGQSTRALLGMPQRLDVLGYRRHLLWRELCATHRRHRAAVILRVRYTGRNRLLQTIHAPIAPDPLARSQIGPQRSALAVGAVTSGARSATDLPVKD